MSFEGILGGCLGKEVIVRSPGERKISGKLIKVDGNYFVEGHYRPLNTEEINSTRQGKILDIELERGSNYFQGGLLN